jgi:transposase-like protein
MMPVINANVARDASVYTDDHRAYLPVGKLRAHEIVAHGRNGFAGQPTHRALIRSGVGSSGTDSSYRQISGKHLNRYLNEFQFRFNHREAEDRFMPVVLNLVLDRHFRAPS